MRRDIEQQCRGRQLVQGQRYRVSIEFIGNWDTKDGLPRRRDVHNLPSKLIDVLAASLGVDDSQFTQWEFKAIHTERHEYVLLKITDCPRLRA